MILEAKAEGEVVSVRMNGVRMVDCSAGILAMMNADQLLNALLDRKVDVLVALELTTALVPYLAEPDAATPTLPLLRIQ